MFKIDDKSIKGKCETLKDGERGRAAYGAMCLCLCIAAKAKFNDQSLEVLVCLTLYQPTHTPFPGSYCVLPKANRLVTYLQNCDLTDIIDPCAQSKNLQKRPQL